MKQVSEHAKILFSLINNAREICCVHNEYKMARDVIRSFDKISKGLGFEIEDHIIKHFLSNIGVKPPYIMNIEFNKLAALVGKIDYKLDKETLTGKQKNGKHK